ncbi:HNH endonuclease signature motif containing protein, partial [Sinomonas gamaensis]|uniref:HNH endonuclease signature motif containing protein n=1 Tax=Sinomonas gamaensis TaxID=2565624 RepID=UPI00110834E1
GAVSEATAARLLHEAADLAAAPELLGALQAGDISYQHAKAILDQTRTLPAPHGAAFARKALARAVTRTGRRRTPAELRSCLRRLREHLHPQTLTARKAAAAAGRGVWLAPEPDGMCTLTARLPAEAAHAIHHGLDHDARTARTAGAPGTLDQLRADALAHRLLARPDGAPAFQARIALTIPLTLALGAEQPETAGPPDAEGAPDAAGVPDAEGAPEAAELEGYGPIDPATARRLAALAPNWERIFADPATGAALGVGRTAYRPPAALRRYLAHRDRGCTFPGCTTPPHRCEPDHTTEWQHGGTTDPHNLALLCPRHHALKSLRAWTYQHTTDQNTNHHTLTWTSPLGHTHTTEPHTPNPPEPEPPQPQPPQHDQPPPF